MDKRRKLFIALGAGALAAMADGKTAATRAHALLQSLKS
jgi:hypothetical protein